MKSLQQLFTSLAFLVLLSCGGTSAEDKILHQAADLHNEAMQIKKEINPTLEELRQLKNGIQVQGRELTSAEINFTKKVERLESSLQYWEENHIEVPGFEHHDHDHSGHDHSHDHSHGSTGYQLPASDLLIIQQEFRDSINSIKHRLKYLLDHAPK